MISDSEFVNEFVTTGIIIQQLKENMHFMLSLYKIVQSLEIRHEITSTRGEQVTHQDIMKHKISTA